MGVVAELGRLSVGAWSPGGAGGGYIAAGAYAGAADASFTAAAASLELLSVDIQRAKLTPVADVPVPDKFCAVDWALPSRGHPAGLIAGGLADGTVRVWDAATLIRSARGGADESTAVVFGGSSAAKRHAGAVRGLAFNPFVPTKLASGAADGQVLVWDLSNPAAGATVRPPAGQPTASNMGPKEEVTALSWNRKVQHILGTATSSGVMNVWDLKQSKQVISIRNARGRLRCSSLSWHPDIPTQIVIACDEDESTGAVMWDLRNATAPVMSYTHHAPKGVVSTSWCPHDSDLLLTSSRDSRTVVVSVSSGEVVSEAPQTANWNFDVKWSPRLPGLYLASAYDGRITVNSLMTATTAPSVSSETANALAESFGEMAGGFQSGVAPQSPRTVETQRVTYNVTRPPKWLKKPVSVSFGFGGLRASANSKDGVNISIESFPESFPGLKESSSKLDEMLMDLTADDPSPALKWCEGASSSAESPKEKMAWDALSIMFQTDSRRALLRYLGFELPPLEAGDDIAMPVYGLSHSQPLAVPVRPTPALVADIPENKVDVTGNVDAVGNGMAGMNLDGPAPWEVSDTVGDSVNVKDSILDGDDTANGPDESLTGKPNGISGLESGDAKVKSFAGGTKEEIDALVKRSVIVGDFKMAVDACLHLGRTADALIIAHAGGPDLWLHTQAEYISRSSLSSGSSIVGAIAGPKSKMDAFISDAAEAGKDSWKEALAVLLTYSSTEDISESITALGQRLLIANNHAAALFCFICAGNTRMSTSVWMRDRPASAQVASAMMADRIEKLGVLVQKVRLLTAAAVLGKGEREIGAVKALDEVSGSILCEYGALLASQGDASLAVTYLSNLDPSYTCVYGSVELISTQATECLSMADDITATLAPNVGGGGTQSYDPYGATYSSSSYNYAASQPYPTGQQGYGTLPPPQPQRNWGTSSTYSAPPADAQAYSSMPPMPGPPVATPPRPTGMFGTQAPTAERSAYDPSAAYAAAPAYNQNSYQAASPPPAPAIGAPPPVSPMNQLATAMPAAPPPPVPMTPIPVTPDNSAPPFPGSDYGMQAQGTLVGGNLGMQSQSLMAPPPPPPPPPTDANAPPPISYHAKARLGSGAALPPSAEVAVAETRRSKPLSSSGTPGGPPRRSTSTSSSLASLGTETVYLEKADVTKVPTNQQVIVKSMRGSYMYALGLNQTPIYKKKMDDISKRLGRLVAGLNAGLVDAPVVQLLIGVGKAIEKGNYNEARAVVSTLKKQHWDSNSQWILGLNRLIDCALTGR